MFLFVIFRCFFKGILYIGFSGLYFVKLKEIIICNNFCIIFDIFLFEFDLYVRYLLSVLFNLGIVCFKVFRVFL